MTDLDKFLVQHIPTIKEVDLLEAMLRIFGDVDPVVLAKLGIRKTGFGYQVTMNNFTTEFGNLQSLLDDVKRYRWQRNDAQEDPEYARSVMAEWGKALGPFLLKGSNIDQVSAQVKFLDEQGFKIEAFRTGQTTVNPGFSKREDYEKAVQAIFLAGIPGYWSYLPEDFGVLGFYETMAKKYPLDKDKEKSWKRDKYEAIKV